MFWLKSRNKFVTALFIATAAIAGLSIMPAEWYERMNTIKTYEEDASAMGRIIAWKVAITIANNRITGGGYETWQPSVFFRYGSTGNDARDVHSIYFEVLGEHGWIGLTLFLTLLVMTWLKCGSIIRMAKKLPDSTWARDLAAMIQVSLVAYMSAGAFLGLAYFDYIYHLVAVAVVVHFLMKRQQAAAMPARAGPSIPIGPTGPRQAPPGLGGIRSS